MKIILPALILTFLFAVKTNAQNCNGKSKQEKKILRLVNSLPEVIKENNYRKRAHIKELLRAYIQNTPSKENNYYSVTISEEKFDRLFTYDWFEVNKRTCFIRYWDVGNTDKTMSLKEWRKLRHARKI